MAGTCRTRTRKAIKNGFTGAVKEATAQDLGPGGAFRSLYEQTMQRLDAASQYFFTDRYYGELLDGLGPNLLIAEVRDGAGTVVSAALLLRDGERLHYHLAGSSVEGMRMGSNNLMMWTATNYAAEQGLRQFHLGGGLTPRDDLFRFKSKFGGREVRYGVSGLIVDNELCQDRLQDRAEACGTTTDALVASNFFPPYRAGTARAQHLADTSQPAAAVDMPVRRTDPVKRATA
jgi:hypothetical protein